MLDSVHVSSIISSPSPLLLSEPQDVAHFSDGAPCLEFPDWREGSNGEHIEDFSRFLMPISPNSSKVVERISQRELSPTYPCKDPQPQDIVAPKDQHGCIFTYHENPKADTQLTGFQTYRRHSDSSPPAHQSQRSTALHEAVKQGNQTIVRLLVEHHANIHALDAHGRTSLHVAVESDNRAIVCYLLELGANLNTPDCSGRVPLETAIASGNEQLVRLLLSKGADVNFWWIGTSLELYPYLRLTAICSNLILGP
jgi:hypothetical protein